jgi:hypothetical protein
MQLAFGWAPAPDATLQTAIPECPIPYTCASPEYLDLLETCGIRLLPRVRQIRDGDVHFHSVATAEVFGVTFERQSVVELWQEFAQPFSASREALLAALAIAMRLSRDKPKPTTSKPI